MCAEAVDSVGHALAILIESPGRRIECGFGCQHISVFINRQVGERDAMELFILVDFNAAILERDLRAIARLHQPQDFAAQRLSGHVSGLAAYKSLARGGSFAAVGGDGGVAGKQIEAIDRATESVGTNLGDDCSRALPDIYGALMKSNSPIGFQAHAHG